MNAGDNIAIEDIKYLENKYKENSSEGNVWKLAKEGKTYFEIISIMDKRNKKIRSPL